MLIPPLWLYRWCFMVTFVSAVLGTGCDHRAVPQDLVGPIGIPIDRTSQQLVSSTGAVMVPKVLKGTYGASCLIHPGEKWALTLSDPTDRRIELQLNEPFASCPLTLTTLQLQVGTSLLDYPLTQPIVLSNSYAATPVVLNSPLDGSVALFVNARLGGLESTVYSNNFSIELVYSDNALACSVTAPAAIYATASAVVYGTFGAPPNYAMAFDALHLSVDKNSLVQSSSGGFVNLKLPTQQPQAGEQWHVFDESARCCRTYSFAAIDTIYRTVTPIATGVIINSGDVNLSFADFALLGQRLPRTRTVIVKHSGGAGLISYELFQVLFPGPL